MTAFGLLGLLGTFYDAITSTHQDNGTEVCPETELGQPGLVKEDFKRTQANEQQTEEQHHSNPPCMGDSDGDTLKLSGSRDGNVTENEVPSMENRPVDGRNRPLKCM